MLGIAAFVAMAAWPVQLGPSPPPGRVVVRVWSGWTGHEKEAFEKAVAAFNRSQSRTFLVNTSTEEDDTKIFRAITAGTPPDLFQVWSGEYVGALAANNAVVPFDPLLARDGPPRKEFIQGSLGLGEYEGRHYSMAYLIDAYALYWNKDVFRAAGLDPEKPPRTLEELQRMALRLVKKRPDGTLERVGFEMPSLEILIVLFGGKFYDPATHTILADHPRNVEALRWLTRMIDAQGGSVRVDSFTAGFGEYASPNHQFFVGKAAMMLSGQWWPSYVEKFAPHIDYGVCPLPYPSKHPELEGTTYIGGNFFCIPSGSRHPKEAWEFLRWTQNSRAQELFSSVMHGVPNMLAVLGSPRLTTGSRHNRAFGVVCRIAANPNARWFPATPVNNLYLSELNTAVQLAARNKKTPEQALHDVRVRVQRELDRVLMVAPRQSAHASRFSRLEQPARPHDRVTLSASEGSHEGGSPIRYAQGRLRGVHPEPKREILRFAQNDRGRRAQKDIGE
jgi:multiple sugar transport system substrate-binding protein